MITTNFVIGIVICHFFGDWWLQSRHMAKHKTEDLFVMFQHIAVLCFPLTLFLLFFLPAMEVAIIIIIYSISHYIQDLIIWNIFKGKYFTWPSEPSSEELLDMIKGKAFYNTIALDQALHLIILFILIGYI